MSTVHSHKCKCGTLWEHNSNAYLSGTAHDCPSCGNQVFTIFQNNRQKDYIQPEFTRYGHLRKARKVKTKEQIND